MKQKYIKAKVPDHIKDHIVNTAGMLGVYEQELILEYIKIGIEATMPQNPDFVVLKRYKHKKLQRTRGIIFGYSQD